MITTQKKLARESDIKPILLNALHAHNLIFQEFIYADGKRRADVVAFDKAFYAYEIKSDVDSLSRLHDQIHDYLKIFDYISCVTTNKYVDLVLRSTHPKIGVYKFVEDNLIKVREAKLNKSTDKYSMLTLLSSRELDTFSRKSGFTTGKLDVHSKRELLAKKLKKDTISTYIKEWYRVKHSSLNINSIAISAE